SLNRQDLTNASVPVGDTSQLIDVASQFLCEDFGDVAGPAPEDRGDPCASARQPVVVVVVEHRRQPSAFTRIETGIGAGFLGGSPGPRIRHLETHLCTEDLSCGPSDVPDGDELRSTELKSRPDVVLGREQSGGRIAEVTQTDEPE